MLRLKIRLTNGSFEVISYIRASEGHSPSGMPVLFNRGGGVLKDIAKGKCTSYHIVSVAALDFKGGKRPANSKLA